MKPSHDDRIKQSFRSGEPIDKALTQAAKAAKRSLEKGALHQPAVATTAKQPQK